MSDIRMIASSVPQTMPAATASTVISRVVCMPAQRKGQAPGIELQSNSAMMAALAGNPDAGFEPVHQAHDQGVQEHEGEGHGDE